MQDSDTPTKIPTPWASSAPGTNITNPVPVAPQTGGHASFTEGYPPVNSVPIASGGIPPWGTDTNGILYMLSALTRWFSAGGPNFYDATFASDSGGYPAGAIIPSTTLGLLWQSTVDNNTSDPDAGGANWVAIPLATRLAHGECYLSYVSATSIKLTPYNGCSIVSGSVQYQLPAAGITAANTNVYVNGVAAQNLANSTTYYVSYDGLAGVLKFWNAATYSHAVDTAAGDIGVEVLTLSGSPVVRQSLVALVRTNSVGQFQAQGTGTLSWFNRRSLALDAAQSDQTTTSVSFVGVGNTISFVAWGDEAVSLACIGNVGNNTASATGAVGVMLDGVATGPFVYNYGYVGAAGAGALTVLVSPSAGAHTFQAGLAANGGTAFCNVHPQVGLRG